jgi:GntR family transcriptional repressor for pyruvate dehydrogenase complex
MPESKQPRSARLAHALRDEILRGQYRPGERLPSERDLAARFGTSRGTVREALKRLEELGLAKIQPGGARAAAVHDCTLQVLGPLLAVESPRSELIDKVLEIAGLLLVFATERAVARGGATDISKARGLLQDILAPHRAAGGAGETLADLFRHLAEAADHLVLTLIVNGLREQIIGHAPGICDARDLQGPELKQIAWKLDAAFDKGHAAQAGAAMQELFALLRGRAGLARADSAPASFAASS